MKQSYCQSKVYTFSDFYYVDQAELVSFNKSPLNSTSRMNSFILPQTRFTNPQILIGITQLDVDTTKVYVGYHVDGTLDNVSQKIKLQAEQFEDSYISNIRIMYMIVEHPNIIIQKGVISIPTSNLSLTVKETKFYQKITSNPPQIQIYLTGYKSLQKGSISKLKISVLQNSSSFDIIIERSDNGFTEVYYNYIEIYGDSNFGFSQDILQNNQINYYYGIENNIENSLQNSQSTVLNAGSSSPYYLKERFSDIISIPVDLVVPSTTATFIDIGYFIGFIHFEFDISYSNIGLRLQIDKTSFLNKVFSFQYRTWFSTRIRGVTSAFTYFKMLKCNSIASFPVNDIYSKTCIEKCEDGFYESTDISRDIRICLACDSKCLTCNGSSAFNCLSCNTQQFLNGSSCDQCMIQCQECIDSSTCTICNEMYPYFFQNNCYAQQPQQAYCDPITQICSSCNIDCNTCSENLKCLTCQNTTDYLLDGNCTINPPPNSFCNYNRECIQCPEQCNNCNYLGQCLQCKNTLDYFYQGNCFSEQQPSTYCQEDIISGITNFCYNCHIACLSCFGPSITQCNSCNNEFILQNSTCNCITEKQQFNENTQQCENCNINGCKLCNQDFKTCQICEDGFLYDNQSKQCNCSNQNEYFDSFLQKCIKNTIQNCQISDKTSNKCIQCLDGYYNYANIMCTYCGNSKYTNNQNQCNQDCQKNCLICTNSSQCLQTINSSNQNQNNPQIPNVRNPLCHYSCMNCNGLSQNNCTQCPLTRQYNIQNSQCECKSGYIDKNILDCQQIGDIGESILNYFRIYFYTIIIFSFPFIIFQKYDNLNYNYNILQMVGLISFDISFNYQSNFIDIIKLFKKTGFYNIMKLEFIYNDNYEQQLELNMMLIFLFIQSISILLLIICNFFKLKTQFHRQLLLSTNMLTSTIQIIIITNLFQINNQYMIILIISTVIQSCIQLLSIQYIYISYKNPYNNQELNTEQNLIPTQQSDLKSNNLFFLNIFLEFRKIILAIIFSILRYNQYSYYLSLGLSFISISILLYSKPFNTQTQNIFATIQEILYSIIICFLSQFKSIDLTQIDKTNQYLIGLIICLILILTIDLLSIIGIITFFIKQKISQMFNQSQQQQIKQIHVQNERVPSTISKNQIDGILQQSKWDLSTMSSLNQRMNIQNYRGKSYSFF